MMIDHRIIDECIYKVSNNDLAALEEVYNYTKDDVFAFSLSILKNSHDAEDVMQDVYLNIYKHADKYSSTGKPLSWILTITKNLCYNKMKKHKGEVNVDIKDIQNITSTHINPDEKILIDTIFETLEDEEKQIIILHELSGFKYIEISKLLELKLSTVISKYHRAIKKIRSKYGKGDEVYG